MQKHSASGVATKLAQRVGPRASTTIVNIFATTPLCLAAILAFPVAAAAQRIENQVAVFAALDKVTAHISRLEIKLGDTVNFGALKITPQRCYSRPPDQPPKTDTFVEVRELQLDGSEKKIFSGWMFAEDPGLNAVEHPVYDVWLTECLSPRSVVGRAPAPAASALTGAAAAGGSPARIPAGSGAAQDQPAAASDSADEPFVRRRPPR